MEQKLKVGVLGATGMVGQRFAAIHKRLVVFRVFHARRNRLVVYARIRVLGCIKQFFLELFAVCLHDEPPM